LFRRCDTIEGLKAAIPTLRKELEDDAKFKDIYLYTFGFSKEPAQRSMGQFRVILARPWGLANCDGTNVLNSADLDMAIGMWALLLKDRFKLLDKWLTFVKV
jgi:DCN1-like protein 1/2